MEYGVSPGPPFSIVLEEKLTEDEVTAFRKLRTMVEEDIQPGFDDLRLIKFLVARKFEVESAAVMVRKHLEYWKKVEVERFLSEYQLQEKSKYFYTSILGFDNEGAIMRLIRVGNSDLKGLAMAHTKLDCVIMAAYLLETDKRSQKERFQETGEGGDDKQTYIIDLEGLQWRIIFFRPLVQLFTLMLRLYEANYPESLKTAYIVNVPHFFSLIYNFLKKMLPADIVNKIIVLSSDQIQPILSGVMDPNMLPMYLGGTRTDPDNNPLCHSLHEITPGTPVPEEYYLMTSLAKDPEAKKATVFAQSSISVKHEVQIPESVLFWDFQTEFYDIAMGLLFHGEGGQEPKSFLPIKRVDSHRFMESGRFRCKDPGTYEIVFDNTYSWWAKKELIYKTWVLKPDEIQPETLGPELS